MTALNDLSQEQNLAEEVRLCDVRLAAVLVPWQDLLEKVSELGKAMVCLCLVQICSVLGPIIKRLF